MFIVVLKKIKIACPWVWNMIECLNGKLVSLLYGKRILTASQILGNDYGTFNFRVLTVEDAQSLVDLIARQPKGFDVFFKPHSFDLRTFKKVLSNKTYLLIGAYNSSSLVGYCFIRFTVNKAAYRGKMVDKAYQGKGIAKTMGILMTKIAVGAGFRLYATISKHNLASLKSSKAVNDIRIIKELPDDYVYIEYVGLK